MSEPSRPKRTLLALGRVLLFWIATMVVLALASPMADAWADSKLIAGAITVPVTLALTIAFIRWEGARLQDYGFALTRSTGPRFALGCLVGLLLLAGNTALMALSGTVQWVRSPAAPEGLLSVLGYLLLATREELAFRGFPLRKLVSEFTPWTAQVLIALLFAIEHLLGGASWANALIGAGMGSLVFGMAAWVTKGLAFPIGLHAAWNVGDWLRGGKAEPGLWKPITQPGSETLSNVIGLGSYTIVMAIALTGLWYWGRIQSQKGPS
jgi:membrane protease YdiL (CAAX protease family)